VVAGGGADVGGDTLGGARSMPEITSAAVEKPNGELMRGGGHVVSAGSCRR
jgi:hypothetical protein